MKKGRDGPSTLACVRDDGSRTWSKLHPFFPDHDLTHCAVESVLGFTRAFFGSVADGWSIDDFAAPGAPARLPKEAIVAECIVGIFDLERAERRSYPASEFNAALGDALRGQGLAPPRAFHDEELQRVRSVRGDLIARWWSIQPGETLEIPFPVGDHA